MRQLSEILRLKHQAGLSHARIAAALRLSKGVVNKYVSLARAKGVGWPLPEGMDEAALERLLFPAPLLPGRGAAPDYEHIHQELKRKGVTLQLLWAEYAAAHGAGALRYSQFCERYRRWRARQRCGGRGPARGGDRDTALAAPSLNRPAGCGCSMGGGAHVIGDDGCPDLVPTWHLLKPGQRNRVHEVVEKKFRRSEMGRLEGNGPNTFP